MIASWEKQMETSKESCLKYGEEPDNKLYSVSELPDYTI